MAVSVSPLSSLRLALSRVASGAVRQAFVLAVASLALVGGGAQAANDTSRPLLVVRAAANGAAMSFTRADLEALGLHRIEAETPWADGKTVFEGPLLRDVLGKAGVEGETLEAVALNDYRVEIPVSDSAEFEMILAMRVNGQQIGVRERGPLWVIYPWDQHPELRGELYYSRSIWQLKELIVKR